MSGISIDKFRRSVSDLPPRIVLMGVEKIGKSTFAAQFPDPVFIPIRGEQGIDAIDTTTAPLVTEYPQLIETLGVLYGEDHQFKTVVIDSVSTLEPLLWDHTCKTIATDKGNYVTGIEAYGYGKGYTNALQFWREILDGLDALRTEKKMGCILIGHVKVKQFNDPIADPYDQYQLDLNDKAANMLYRWADCILFANRKVISKTIEGGFNKKVTHAIGKDDPMLYTRKRPSHPGGGRGAYGQLPYELPLNYEAFINAVNQAKNGN